MNPPTAKTLAKYGLSEKEWLTILAAQGGVCAVCKKVPNGRLCIDHDHIKNWRKLPPEKRKIHVRGLLCWFCNHAYVGRAITAEKSRNVTLYLEAHTERVLQHVMRVQVVAVDTRRKCVTIAAAPGGTDPGEWTKRWRGAT